MEKRLKKLGRREKNRGKIGRKKFNCPFLTPLGSRQTFMLPTKWQKEEYEHGSKTRLQFSSLGKTKYTTDKVMRGMKECLHNHLASASSSKESQTGESEFMQSSKEEEMKGSQTKLWKGEDMERRWFVC